MSSFTSEPGLAFRLAAAPCHARGPRNADTIDWTWNGTAGLTTP